MTPAERLYNAAYKEIGHNLAPGNEMLGCAISMSAVYNRAFPEKTPLRLVNTTQWYNYMTSHPEEFQQIDRPEPMCVFVYPTDMRLGESPIKHGHIFVCGKKLAPDESYYTMSNNSDRGCWDTHWTVQEAENYYSGYGKIERYCFKILG